MISVSCSRASLTARSVLPEAVGPVTTISFFKRCRVVELSSCQVGSLSSCRVDEITN